jgi:hypothetical protein
MGNIDLDPKEFAALAAEQRARIAGYPLAAEKLKAEAAAAEAARQKAEASLQRIESAQSALSSEFTSARDGSAKRLLDGCPAVVHERVALCKSEAAALKTDSYALPPEPLRGTPSMYTGPAAVGEIVDNSIGAALAALPRNVSNIESVSARRRGLFALADQILDWTWKGEFTTVAEFEQLFARAYAALPKVEALQETLQRDIRGRNYVKTVAGRPALPPGA